jgi:hypothetical protein
MSGHEIAEKYTSEKIYSKLIDCDTCRRDIYTNEIGVWSAEVFVCRDKDYIMQRLRI